MAVALTTFCLF